MTKTTRMSRMKTKNTAAYSPLTLMTIVPTISDAMTSAVSLESIK